MKNNDQDASVEQRINDLITQAPVAISFLKGYELIIESANPHILELWDKQNDIIGKPLAAALSGAQGRAYVQLLREVYKNGHIQYGSETKVWLYRNGYRNLFYFDFVYKPVKDASSMVTGVMIVATEVTKQVVARQLLEDAEERLRLAIEATGIATWDLDMLNDIIITSPRLTEIFGLDPDEKVTHQQLRDMVHPDDKQTLLKAFEIAEKTSIYLYDARVVWADGSIRWIRTSGKLIFDDRHKPLRMLGTTHDITERKQDELMKNDFIAMASHELKTPLTSLKAYTQLLVVKAKKMGDAFFIGALEKSENQINKMTRLIHGFLDMSKIESGKLQLNATVFDVNLLTAEVVADSLPGAMEHDILFNAGAPVLITADKEKIAEVIGNLISNAVKYSAKGSTVTITTKTEGQQLRLSVKDQGIGLKQKDQQKIFQRFFRVDNERTRGLSGFGIGLYLSAEIIRMHHGKIAVESEEGKGAEFYFLLPLAVLPA
ncbi:ATP-binding protein [Mucilaginibacter sp. SP1R1]|uniref:ATP-binding protein n=1 Tax=Mucilaginibacter sp. SP1R1 TaxID=2723091 RepID=UPI00160DA220|nr:ATP-binding protein [Mucilaginibacter sp. SP1R1]MBB6147840.1 PAS domain S-box-containing protein [Mucilaginibacter sp. SP1R1]